LLDVPLLCRSTEKQGMIDTNFPGFELLLFFVTARTRTRARTYTIVSVVILHVYPGQPIMRLTSKDRSAWPAFTGMYSE